MCNVAADVVAKMEQTVRQFLDEGRMFTGYDVTLETRNRENLRLHHGDCRGVVHEMQFLSDAVDFGYDTNGQTVNWKKIQTVIDGKGWAFVYHPANLDPASYQSGATGITVAAKVPQISVTPSAVVSVTTVVDDSDDSKDSGGENSDGTFSTDYRNRLMVKTRFARHIGLNPGDDVTIVADSTKQTITLLSRATMDQTSAIVVSTQRVERNGDFRLSSSTLRSAGLNGSKFKIEQSSVPSSNGTAMNIIEIFAA